MTQPAIGGETLMAYVDGELDAPEREAVERALRDDPALAAQAERMTALRRRLQQGLAAELEAPGPERFVALLRKPEPAPAVDLAAERARRAEGRRAPIALSWQAWGGLAAGLLLGVLVARGWPAGYGTLFEPRSGGTLVARGALDRALTQRLAADTGGPVAVQLSFVDSAGAYCRTFALERQAGLACREGASWAVVQALAPAAPSPPGALRQAATALPPAVLAVVDARIAGTALDAAAEHAARSRGWQR